MLRFQIRACVGVHENTRRGNRISGTWLRMNTSACAGLSASQSALACVSNIYKVGTDDTHTHIWWSETLGRRPWWRAAWLLCVRPCEDWLFCLTTVRANWECWMKRKQICGRDGAEQALRSVCGVETGTLECHRFAVMLVKWLYKRSYEESSIFMSRTCVWLFCLPCKNLPLWQKGCIFPPHPTLLVASFPTLCCRGGIWPVGGSVCFTQRGLTLAITGHIWCRWRLQRWLHTFHSLMKPFNDSCTPALKTHTHTCAHTHTHTRAHTHIPLPRGPLVIDST